MSTINSSGYVLWCIDEGFVNDEGYVDTMEYWYQYSMTRDYAQEHDEQERKINREYNNDRDNHSNNNINRSI